VADVRRANRDVSLRGDAPRPQTPRARGDEQRGRACMSPATSPGDPTARDRAEARRGSLPRRAARVGSRLLAPPSFQVHDDGSLRVPAPRRGRLLGQAVGIGRRVDLRQGELARGGVVAVPTHASPCVGPGARREGRARGRPGPSEELDAPADAVGGRSRESVGRTREGRPAGHSRRIPDGRASLGCQERGPEARVQQPGRSSLPCRWMTRIRRRVCCSISGCRT
jgi:hypothetical protein